MPDYLMFQKSISEELISIKDRVRNLIDDRHWQKEGEYKEAILRDVIAERLPSYAAVGTGFVVGDNEEISGQIDIIVYRVDYPLLFKKADFVIVPSEAVLGIVEVKTNLTSSKMTETFKSAADNGRMISHLIFNGVFSFECEFQLDTHIPSSVERACKQCNGGVNNVAFGPNYFMKFWHNDPLGVENDTEYRKYHIYRIDRLSFGYFISNLIEDVYLMEKNGPLPEGLRKVFYPIENTKEACREHTITVGR